MRNGTAAVAVEDPSQVGEVRRMAMRVAAEVGFDESARSDVGIVATEAATNVVRHAGRGEVLISEVENGLELICLDHGPGLADVEASMRDGYSGAGSLGGGLGAMRGSPTSSRSTPASGSAPRWSAVSGSGAPPRFRATARSGADWRCPCKARAPAETPGP